MQLSGKLVRDLIPTLMQKDKQQMSFRRLSPGERISHLRAKLVEECTELLNAHARPDILEELGDVKEVFDVLIRLLGREEVASIAAQYTPPSAALSAEHVHALRASLLESAKELQAAEKLQQYESNAKTFATVFRDTLSMLHVSPEEIARRQKRKRDAKGGFTKFYVLTGPT